MREEDRRKRPDKREPAPGAYGDAQHRHPRRLTRLLDNIFHLMKWLWGAVIFGGLGVGVLLVLAQYGTSGLARFSFVQWMRAHPRQSLAGGAGVFALLLLLTLIGWIAHRQTNAFQEHELLPTVRVKELKLENFKLGSDPKEAYFERAVFATARELVRKIVRGAKKGAKDGRAAGNQPVGIILYGLPLIGKTRLALQALRHEAPEYELLAWRHKDIPRWTLERLRGRRVALLLDDLQEFANPTEAAGIQAAVEKLRDVCKRPIVIATCRAGDDRDAVERQFGGMLQWLAPLDLTPIERGGPEYTAFVDKMRAEHVEVHTETFDGTPGSAVLDLKRRTDQLSDRAFPRDALAILKALRLLRASQTYDYPEGRVRRVAATVFGQSEAGGAWDEARGYLARHGWLRLERANAAGESGLAVPTDAYLDICAAAVYPDAGRRLADDFPRLKEALSAPPADADALFSLAEALREDPLGDKAAQYELAIAAVEAGLAALDTARSPVDWAAGQVTLGNAYLYRIRGERADNLEAALAAYQQALTVYTPAAFPAAWATTQNNLGEAYRNRIRGERADNLEAALAAYQQALTVYTRAAFPVQWATTQNNLGLAYADRIRGERADNLEAALAAYQQALTVYTRAAFPVQWALTQNNLGAAYLYRIRGERADNLEAALAAYQQALTVYTPTAFPVQWAETTYNVGLLYAILSDEARQRGDPEQCRAHREAALAAMRSTLDVFTEDGFPADHADALRQIARIEAIDCDDAG